MWRSFAVIGRGSSEITRWKKRKHHEHFISPPVTTYGRPNKPNRDNASSNYKWRRSDYYAAFCHFFQDLRNQWPWISLRGHSRSYILAAIESLCTILYMPLIVTFAVSSTFNRFGDIVGFVRPCSANLSMAMHTHIPAKIRDVPLK